MNAHDFAMTIVRRIVERTGITATAGIGSNLYLAKVAMDIKAKRMPADSQGVRIAHLDEMSFRKELWSHRPLTDFWRIGHGIAARLESMGLYTMGDVARCSLSSQEWLYRIFGVNAELLIDHSWGWEPVGMADIKNYKPVEHSLQSGQILPHPYSTRNARNVLIEMCDNLCLDMVWKGLATDHVGIYIGYERKGDNLNARKRNSIHGHAYLGETTASWDLICARLTELFDKLADRSLMIRRLGVSAMRVLPQPALTPIQHEGLQLNLFCDSERQIDEWMAIRERRIREYRRQRTMATIKQRYGKNAILRGINFSEGATQRERNHMIGGHSA